MYIKLQTLAGERDESDNHNLPNVQWQEFSANRVHLELGEILKEIVCTVDVTPIISNVKKCCCVFQICHHETAQS